LDAGQNGSAAAAALRRGAATEREITKIFAERSR
jgi:hypothetical protein